MYKGTTMNEDIMIKALEVIESISANIGCTTSKKITVAKKDIDDIYCFAHIARGTCEAKHEDWKKHLLETHKKLKEQGEI